MWYVNGEEYMTTKVAELQFKPQENGKYVISAQYLGYPEKILNEVQFTVKKDLWKIITISIAAVLGFSIFVVALVVELKRSLNEGKKC